MGPWRNALLTPRSRRFGAQCRQHRQSSYIQRKKRLLRYRRPKSSAFWRRSGKWLRARAPVGLPQVQVQAQTGPNASRKACLAPSSTCLSRSEAHPPTQATSPPTPAQAAHAPQEAAAQATTTPAGELYKSFMWHLEERERDRDEREREREERDGERENDYHDFFTWAKKRKRDVNNLREHLQWQVPDGVLQ